jgi:hypothetical protein
VSSSKMVDSPGYAFNPEGDAATKLNKIRNSTEITRPRTSMIRPPPLSMVVCPRGSRQTPILRAGLPSGPTLSGPFYFALPNSRNSARRRSVSSQ